MPVSSGRTGKEGHSVMSQARGEAGRFVRGTGFLRKVPAAVTRGRSAGGYRAAGRKWAPGAESSTREAWTFHSVFQGAAGSQVSPGPETGLPGELTAFPQPGRPVA